MFNVAVFVSVGWIISVCFHEFGHAIVAYWGGDISVKDKGYLTLNPLKYIDPFGTILLPILFLMMGGIALPGAAVYIDHSKLRDRKWKSAVSAAGPFDSIIVALFLYIPFLLGFAPNYRELFLELRSLSELSNNQWIWPALAFLIILQISAVILNLLPIPGLDGYGIIEPWLPNEMRVNLRKFSRYGILILFGALWFVRPLAALFWDSTFGIGERLGVSSAMAQIGLMLFQEKAKFLLLAVLGVFVIGRRVISPHKFWYDQGNSYLGTGRYEKALECYDKAVKTKPDYYEAWHQKGYALIQLERYEEAIAVFDKAIEFTPENAGLWMNKAISLSYLKRYEESILCYEKVLEIKPDDYLIWYNKAIILSELKRYEEAIASYDRAISIKPDDPAIWTNKAVSQGHLQRYEEAIATCNKAIEIDPKYTFAWYNKAGCFAEQENFDLTIENLRQAMEIDADLVMKHIKDDPSFDRIRESDIFKKLIKEYSVQWKPKN